MERQRIIPESDPSDDEVVPQEVIQQAEETVNNLLPKKSKTKYEKVYTKFIQWQSSKQIKSFSETVFVTYFSELAQKLKPTSLWATHSMLRSMVHLKHKINIYNYSNLIAFLKQQSKGFTSKKAKALTAEQIKQFLTEAPDSKYLAVKVALIFGIQGACRRQELCDITINNIQDKGDMVIVNIPETKNDKPRTFVINEEFYHIYKKYAALRPKDVNTTRFFLSYHKSKCSTQVIGVNTFGNMPKTVASYLKLEDPQNYTGHTFRRTSATILADSGADLLTIKRHGGWKSNTVAEGYVDSINKKKIGQRISDVITDKPNSSRSNICESAHTSTQLYINTNIQLKENIAKIESESNNAKHIHFNISNCTNFTINIVDKKKV